MDDEDPSMDPSDSEDSVLHWLLLNCDVQYRAERSLLFPHRVQFPDESVAYFEDIELCEAFRIVLSAAEEARPRQEPPKRKRKRKKRRKSVTRKKKARTLKTEDKRRKRYREYLQSDEWKAMRSLVLKRDHASCILCGSTLFLHVHHRHYKTLYAETGKELATLCRTCHKSLHAKGWKATGMGGMVLRDVR